MYARYILRIFFNGFYYLRNLIRKLKHLLKLYLFRMYSIEALIYCKYALDLYMYKVKNIDDKNIY